ncbi:MAG: zinc ABC transporter substrate-binding protein [Streptosporangiales bacterium]|nr:zinc ABC transporter substrate-binding protein [Streptosporangiales bacterium]
MAVAAAGCQAGSPAGASAEGSSGKTVVASIYPLGWLSGQVGGDRLGVSTLTEPGVEPHDLELTPRQAVEIGSADLVVYIKGMQPAVDDTITSRDATAKALDATTLIEPLHVTGEAEEEHGHEHGHEHGEEQGHGAETIDPHLWLDPSRMATVATALGERFAKVDPEGAAGYRQRAKAAAAELTKLDEEFRTGLKTCDSRTMVANHQAFGYLADRYDLKQISISGVDAEAEPSPAQLARAADLARKEKVTTIFTETLLSPKVAQVLAREVGVKTAVLDPVEGTKEGSTDTYPSVMRRNLQTLRTALGCR